MRAVFLYFLQVVLASGILYGYYHFFLRNKKFHQYNRFYLLITTFLSLVIPFLHIDIYFSSAEEIPAVYQVLATVRAGNPIPGNQGSFFTWQKIIQLFYCVIALLFLVRIAVGLWRIFLLKMYNYAERLDDISFIHTQEEGTPFSFFRWLFWNEKIPVDSRDGKTIFRHELFHIRQKHSWDLLWLEVLTALFWINPFFHLVKKETKTIHEFLADRFALEQSDKWDYAELLMMQALQTSHRLINPFFHNQIKRRIAMITNSSKPGFQYLRKLMVLPVTFFIVTLIAVNCTSKDIKTDIKEAAANKVDEKIKNPDGLQKIIRDSVDEVIEEKILAQKLKKTDLDQIKKEIKNKDAVVEEPDPTFTGGRPAWALFLQKNLNANVPVDNGAPEGTYTVMTQFMVDKNGKITDLKALTNFGYGMEQEVLRVMKLSPSWTPATRNGKAVDGYKRQPVTFSISAE